MHDAVLIMDLFGISEMHPRTYLCDCVSFYHDQELRDVGEEGAAVDNAVFIHCLCMRCLAESAKV